ncbi:MAG: glycosyltransferase family 2 protein [Acidobacteria bacterium]|nr:glycosyltransferase family 2 protein [Acidobacteriota bacterium]
MPTVSVIIATHSRPHLLPRAIESARKAGTDVEVIVVDDASTDETAEVCRNLKDIKYVRAERNQRVAGARNLGILVSSAEYISFLDDDDVRLPGTLDIQVNTLDRFPEIGLVYGQVINGDQNCLPTSQPPWPSPCPQGDIFWLLLETDFIPCLSAVFRKSCLMRVGLLNATIPGVDDWDLWVRIAEIYPILAIEQPVAIWRVPTPESGQGSSSPMELTLSVSSQFRECWLNLPRAVNVSKEQKRDIWNRFINRVADGLVFEAADEMNRRKYISGCKKILLSLRLNPSRAFRPRALRFLLGRAYKLSVESIASLLTSMLV